MDNKEQAVLLAEQLRAAKRNYIKDGPPPNTWQTKKPAYCYTVLCPVPELRKVPVKKENKVNDESGVSAPEIKN